jgi:hypothetical protein
MSMVPNRASAISISMCGKQASLSSVPYNLAPPVPRVPIPAPGVGENLHRILQIFIAIVQLMRSVTNEPYTVTPSAK